MHIASTFDELARQLNGRQSSLTIGVFDGVHLGHQALVAETVSNSRQHGNVAVAVSFLNHPLSTLAPPYTPMRLVTPARKANLLERMGIEILLLMEFTREFASVEPDRFITDYLGKAAAVKNLVCGYDFTFGSQGSGNVEMLHQYAPKLGFNVHTIDAVTYENTAVKSTHIRDLLSVGHVYQAARILTRPHEVPGIVGSGMRRGRSIGFPTANLRVPEHFQMPGIGVYLCGARLGIQPRVWPAMVNIGTNPTFGGNAVSVEAHILNFNEDINGQKLSLFFMERLRDEQKFSGVDALVEQLNKDRDQTALLWNSAVLRELADKIPGPISQS